MHLLYFDPPPFFLENIPDNLHKILQFVQKCYDNRLYLKQENIEEADFFLTKLQEYQSSNPNDTNALQLTNYFISLNQLLHKEYDIQAQSTIAFLVYYLKSPSLLLDDPVFLTTKQLVKGLDPAFISSFIIEF